MALLHYIGNRKLPKLTQHFLEYIILRKHITCLANYFEKSATGSGSMSLKTWFQMHCPTILNMSFYSHNGFKGLNPAPNGLIRTSSVWESCLRPREINFTNCQVFYLERTISEVFPRSSVLMRFPLILFKKCSSVIFCGTKYKDIRQTLASNIRT